MANCTFAIEAEAGLRGAERYISAKIELSCSGIARPHIWTLCYTIHVVVADVCDDHIVLTYVDVS